MLAGIADCFDLALDTTVAKTARNEDTIDIAENLINILRCDCFGINPFDMDGHVIRDTAVL